MVRDLINKKMVTKLNYTLKHLIMKNKKILKWLIAGFIARDMLRVIIMEMMTGAGKININTMIKPDGSTP